MQNAMSQNIALLPYSQLFLYLSALWVAACRDQLVLKITPYVTGTSVCVHNNKLDFKACQGYVT